MCWKSIAKKLDQQYQKIKRKDPSFEPGTFVHLLDKRSIMKRKQKNKFFQLPFQVLEERPKSVLLQALCGQVSAQSRDNCIRYPENENRQFASLPAALKF